jgi:phosphohistidine swiveling domain-containing protein
MNFTLPFDPNGNIFRWGPIPGKFLYTSTFVEVHYKHFRAKYGENWSETLWLFSAQGGSARLDAGQASGGKDGRSFWVNNTPDVEAAGKRVFIRYMLPQASRQKIYQEWLRDVKAIQKIENDISNTELARVENIELLRLWNSLLDAYAKFWTTGSVPELANYGSTHYLTEKLRPLVSSDQDVSHILEVLTAPTKLSFYQEEEAALAKATDLTKHQEQFFWLKNSYVGTQVLPAEFFAERKKTLNQDIKKEIERKLSETIARKSEVQKQFNLPAQIMEIAEAISDGVGWQDERKKHIFIILHYIDVLVQEVARRFGYNFNELHNLWHHEIAEIIEGKDLHQKLIERAKGFGVQFFHACKELNAEQTEYLWKVYSTEKIEQGVSEVKGIVASKGKGGVARGKIHILLDPMKAETFQDGEILVAPMTSPEYIFAMKKASAILTDTGGLTSHAAIVSRELGIPCLVGTKVATTIFKDGDMVEVDAGQGMAWKV